MDIVEFLLARLDEDEARNQPLAVGEDQAAADAVVKPTILLNLARQHIRDDIATRRRIVEEHEPLEEYAPPITFCGACGGNPTRVGSYPCYTMRLLALSYGAHPDYRQEWEA